MSETITADVEIEESYNLPDDFADAVAEAEEKFAQAEIETLQRQLNPQSAEEPKTEEGDKPEAGSAKSKGKGRGGIGFDKILKNAESKLGKESAEAIRKVQSDYVSAQTKLRRAEAQLAEYEAYKLQQAPPAEEVDPDLARITPKQWDIFDKMALKRGYVRQQDVLAQEREEQTATYYSQEVQEAIERFGEQLGMLDNEGNLLLSDEIEPEFQAQYARIFDPERGLTAKDLFILARFDQLMEEAREEGGRQYQETRAQGRPIVPRRPAYTERNSTSLPSRANLFRKGDSLEEVVRKAASSALRGS